MPYFYAIIFIIIEVKVIFPITWSKRITMNDKPIIAQKMPYPTEVEKGKNYYWCRCGRSNKQPFCDGSHKVTSFSPVAYKATETKKMFFCGCKSTSNQPFCDGTHRNI